MKRLDKPSLVTEAWRDMPFNKKALGIAIEQIRIMRKMSRSALAKAVGVSEKTITFVEQGRKEPKRSVIGTIAQVLNIPPECLIALGITQISDDASARLLVNKVKEMIFQIVKSEEDDRESDWMER